jgi:23S rRNA pseudouridine2457 synthase
MASSGASRGSALENRETYFVQIEGEPDKQALTNLRRGVVLNDGKTAARPPRVASMSRRGCGRAIRPSVFVKRFRRAWIELTIREGRNRQVRRMTAPWGYPTLRLIRWSIGEWTLEGLAPGRCSPQVTSPYPRSAARAARDQHADERDAPPASMRAVS